MPARPRSANAFQQERKRQLRFLLLLALLVLTASLYHAGFHRVFTPGWWRLW